MIEALQEFSAVLAHPGEGLGHANRHAGLRGYCTGPMSPLSRKSVELMAAHVGLLKLRSRHQSRHHFVADANGSDAQMLLCVCQWVMPLMDFSDGGWWIIDDTDLPKQGRHSVAVARPYCGMLGKQDPCKVGQVGQVAVSVSLACAAASMTLAWRGVAVVPAARMGRRPGTARQGQRASSGESHRVPCAYMLRRYCPPTSNNAVVI